MYDNIIRGHPLTYDRIPLGDGRILVFKRKIECPLYYDMEKNLHFTYNEELDIADYAYGDHMALSGNVADTVAALYIYLVDSKEINVDSLSEQEQMVRRKLIDLLDRVEYSGGR